MIQIHKQKCTYAHIQYKCTRIKMRIHIYTHAMCIQIHMKDIHSNIRTYAQVWTHIYKQKNIYIHSHIQENPNIDKYMYVHTQMYTHIHIRAFTHTHEHIYTQYTICVSRAFFFFFFFSFIFPYFYTYGNIAPILTCFVTLLKSQFL